MKETFDPATMNRIQQEDTVYQNIANPEAKSTSSYNYIYPDLKWTDSYITNWDKIYTTAFGNTLPGSTATTGSWLYEGMPFLKIKKGEKVKYDIAFKDSSKTYRVYDSLSPFQKTGSGSSKPVKISLDGATFTDYVDITGAKQIQFNFDTINPITETSEQILWLKWTEVNGGTLENGGGTLMITGHNTARVTLPE